MKYIFLILFLFPVIASAQAQKETYQQKYQKWVDSIRVDKVVRKMREHPAKDSAGHKMHDKRIYYNYQHPISRNSKKGK